MGTHVSHFYLSKTQLNNMCITPRDPKKWQSQEQGALENVLQNQGLNKLFGKIVPDCPAEWKHSFYIYWTTMYQGRWYNTTGTVIPLVQPPRLEPAAETNIRDNCTDNQWITSRIHITVRKCKITREQKKERTVSYS